MDTQHLSDSDRTRHYPLRRRWWWQHSRCVCGARWPCQDSDRRQARGAVPMPTVWNTPTAAYQAPLLTLAGQWRANGGRWPATPTRRRPNRGRR